jgi:hypothetical protein
LKIRNETKLRIKSCSRSDPIQRSGQKYWPKYTKIRGREEEEERRMNGKIRSLGRGREEEGGIASSFSSLAACKFSAAHQHQTFQSTIFFWQFTM